MIEDFKKRYNSYGGWSGKDNPMYNPLIWIKNKVIKGKYLIVNYYENEIVILGEVHSLKALFNGFTYLDGSPCGIEE